MKKDIQEEFDKLNKNKKIEVLYNAIGFMESNNSQSQLNAIARAMGVDNYERDCDFSAI